MDTSLNRMHDFDARSDAVATAMVLATILVSALCWAFLLSAGIAIAE